ncbi:MAG: glycoside hydrolase family 31 protein [Eubacteriales bacterium]|nr:glycoside hydrolase family 31 protein [Eubacteriales bacterium]
MSETRTVEMLPGECWWGGAVNLGHAMPLDAESVCVIDPNGGRENDQFAPLYLSSKGRYLWSERPYCLKAEKGRLVCEGVGEILLGEGYENLRGAYSAACQAFFSFTGELPDRRFFTQPQYNTWIELGTDQTTDHILRYARGILEHGLPAGILMIDEGWQADYGIFEFNKEKIPDPAKLVYELHQMGFGVMLWVTPTVACAGPQFKKLRDQNFLIRDAEGEIALRAWWNGYSAVLDLTNPDAAAWYHRELKRLITCYGVDGFKFDAGDAYFYTDDDQTYRPVLAREQTAVFNEVGSHYALNEFRAAWKFGGKPIVARLHDKYHRWNDFGLNTLIPHTLLQGLLGYAYCCPDMVGGGILDCFNQGQKMDEELFVRWAQANALMGMMQMSISPWRVLDADNAALVVEAMKLHASLGEQFYTMAQETAHTGEPISRHMSYVYPDDGLEKVDAQFMLGETILAAPVLERGAKEKTVYLPKGKWLGWNGQTYEGGQTVTLPVTLRDIPRFTRL